MHKAIRRLTPAPRARRVHQTEVAALAAAATAKKTTDKSILVDIAEGQDVPTIHVGSYDSPSDMPSATSSGRPQTAIFMKRRSSGGIDGSRVEGRPVPIKASLDEMRQQLRLGPANRAAQPLKARPLFKIKQGLAVTPRSRESETGGMPPRSISMMARLPTLRKAGENETTPLLASMGGPEDVAPGESSHDADGTLSNGDHNNK